MRTKHVLMLAVVSALGLNGYGAWAAGTQGTVSGSADVQTTQTAGTQAGAGLDLAANAGTSQTNAATPAQPGGDDGRAVPALPGNPVAQERVEANRPDLDRGDHPERVDKDRPELERAERYRAEVERPDVQRPEMERPEVERPEVQRPEVERPEVQRPERPEVERPDNGAR